MADSVSSPNPAPRPVTWKQRLTLALIFAPIFAPLLALLLLIAAIFISAAFADETIELKRGNLFHEWLREEPLRDFPASLIEGTRRYFWSGGEISPSSNSLIIDTPTLDAKHLKLATEWLVSRGFTVTHESSSDLEFVDSSGRRAQIRHTKERDGGSVKIRIDCGPP